jgi:hypothetical protein
MFDLKQTQEVIAQLRRAAEPRPIDPALPLVLARVKAEMKSVEPGADSWLDASSSGLVEAGLAVLRDCLKKPKI